MILGVVAAFVLGAGLVAVAAGLAAFRVGERHAAQMAALAAAQLTATEAMLRLATTGHGAPVEAVVQDREPDPVERAARRVSEATLAAGMAALGEEYRQNGITVSPDELRAEVESLMLDLAPARPMSL